MNLIMRKIIIFLLRKHFGLKKYEYFRFTNQKSKDIYYFSPICLMKMEHGKYNTGKFTQSSVSLNWILSPECEIQKLSE